MNVPAFVVFLCHENNTVVSSTHMFQKLRMKAAFRVGSVLCHEQRFFFALDHERRRGSQRGGPG